MGTGRGRFTKLRPPNVNELSGLNDLILRSKAVWGYDQSFLDACREELSLEPHDLSTTSVRLLEAEDGRVAGVVQLAVAGATADLLKLFVDPDRLGEGCGGRLYAWACAEARRLGARQLFIEADPGAADFYRRMGAVDAGTAPSGSIAGRRLPRLVTTL